MPCVPTLCLALPCPSPFTLLYPTLSSLPCTALLLDLYPLYYSHHNHLHYRPNPSTITTLPQLPPSCYEEKCQACNRSSQAVNRKVQRRDMTSTALTSLLSHPIHCFGSLCSSFSHFLSHSSTNSPFRIVTHCTALHILYTLYSLLCIVGAPLWPQLRCRPHLDQGRVGLRTAPCKPLLRPALLLPVICPSCSIPPFLLRYSHLRCHVCVLHLPKNRLVLHPWRYLSEQLNSRLELCCAVLYCVGLHCIGLHCIGLDCILLY